MYIYIYVYAYFPKVTQSFMKLGVALRVTFTHVAREPHHNRYCEFCQSGLTQLIEVNFRSACQIKPQTALFRIISNYLLKNRSTTASAADTVMKLSAPK
jgi:hypothetical protein